MSIAHSSKQQPDKPKRGSWIKLLSITSAIAAAWAGLAWVLAYRAAVDQYDELVDVLSAPPPRGLYSTWRPEHPTPWSLRTTAEIWQHAILVSGAWIVGFSLFAGSIVIAWHILRRRSSKS